MLSTHTESLCVCVYERLKAHFMHTYIIRWIKKRKSNIKKGNIEQLKTLPFPDRTWFSSIWFRCLFTAFFLPHSLTRNNASFNTEGSHASRHSISAAILRAMFGVYVFVSHIHIWSAQPCSLNASCICASDALFCWMPKWVQKQMNMRCIWHPSNLHL